MRWRSGLRWQLQPGQDASDDSVLHLRSEVRQQVYQYPRTSMSQEVACRERQTTQATATARTAETISTALTPGYRIQRRIVFDNIRLFTS